MKRIVGVGGSLMFMDGGMFPGYGKSYVNDDYIQAVLAGGGVPLLVPVIGDEAAIEAQVALLDALVISGGWDVDPLLWGEEPHTKLGDTLPERDAFDLALIRAARKKGIPILGICRGIQILNVAGGGTLYQDVSEQPRCTVRHWQPAHPAQPTHTVETVAGSLIAGLVGPSVVTNSFHHMTLKDIAPGYRVTARAKDGTVEAIESIEGSPVLGVQWHPEMMHRTSAAMLRLFEWISGTFSPSGKKEGLS